MSEQISKNTLIQRLEESRAELQAENTKLSAEVERLKRERTPEWLDSRYSEIRKWHENCHQNHADEVYHNIATLFRILDENKSELDTANKRLEEYERLTVALKEWAKPHHSNCGCKICVAVEALRALEVKNG
jgi:predicted RNase H-like nuclease (RuvC/YqgF family)